METVPIPWIKLRRGGHDSSQKMVIYRSLCECIFCCSVIQLCLTLCNLMDCSMPGFPVLHSLSEFAKTHVRWIGDAIQSSHPLLSPPPPAFNLSQHQGLFQWVSSLHQRTKVLELQIQHQSFQCIFRVNFPLGLTGLISLLFKGLSRVFYSTTVWKHHSWAISLLYGPTLTSVYDCWKNHSFD